MIRVPLLLMLCLLSAGAATEARADPARSQLDQALDAAESLAAIRTVHVARDGQVLAGRGFHGRSPSAPTNIKSASKAVLSALVGIAIDKGLLEGVDQPIAPLLAQDLPANPDPRLAKVSVGHLLSMQAGLERTSGRHYGRWVSSGNWVRTALAQPFVDEPGGRMLYSTGSSHLLSAILARQSGRSTLALARDWLGPLEGFSIAAWDRDPQGIHFGGNQMAMPPASLLAFGELYRNGGTTADGRRLVSREWIEQSWTPRTRSQFHDDGHGYGWFMREIGGHPVRYAWGYGGQMLYVVPSMRLTVVMTSDDSAPSAGSGHRGSLHALLGEIIAALE